MQRQQLRHGDWVILEANGVFNGDNLGKMRSGLEKGQSGTIDRVEVPSKKPATKMNGSNIGRSGSAP